MGLTAVIEHLPGQYTKRMLGSKSQRAVYVSTLLNSTQRPFIWEYFRPGTIEVPKGEEAFYDEVSAMFSVQTIPKTLCQKRRGPFQSIPVLRAFSVYFTSFGIQTHCLSEDTGRPVGALALAAAAISIVYFSPVLYLIAFQVERGYHLHHSGDYVSNTNEFSSTNWLKVTNMYVDKIKNDITEDNWEAIFNALDRLEETCACEAQVNAGVVPEVREPLLPADPPTPPPA